MALLGQIFSALLLLQFELHLIGGTETEIPKVPPKCPNLAGVPGTPGHNGLPGRDGKDGKDGKDGVIGPIGEKGNPGLSVQGPPGKAGPTGLKGQKGQEGSVGPKGQKGDPGLSVKGPAGPAGPAGLTGQKGQEGSVGPKGGKGDPGLSVKGPAGPAGPAGLKGQKGQEGSAGPKGEKGHPGPPDTVNNNLIRSLKSELEAVKVRLATIEKAATFKRFKKVGQKFYVSIGQEATYDKGLKLCADAGGRLVLPRSEAENIALSAMHEGPGSAYILLGISDKEKEGQFVDQNKARLVFSNWAPNEPNDYKGQEDCAGTNVDNQWNDYPCDSFSHVVCEI